MDCAMIKPSGKSRVIRGVSEPGLGGTEGGCVCGTCEEVRGDGQGRTAAEAGLVPATRALQGFSFLPPRTRVLRRLERGGVGEEGDGVG